jgi:hypothetical protein
MISFHKKKIKVVSKVIRELSIDNNFLIKNIELIDYKIIFDAFSTENIDSVIILNYIIILKYIIQLSHEGKNLNFLIKYIIYYKLKI